jgi:hypothetical protein
MQVDGMEDGKCSLRKASPSQKRTGMTTCAKGQMALLTSRDCFSPTGMQCYQLAGADAILNVLGVAVGGTLWAFCACRLMFPALELPDCESTRMVVYFLLSLFKNRPNFLHDDNKYAYIAFDRMCHVRRLIKSKVQLHPKLTMFLEQVRI